MMYCNNWHNHSNRVGRRSAAAHLGGLVESKSNDRSWLIFSHSFESCLATVKDSNELKWPQKLDKQLRYID